VLGIGCGIYIYIFYSPHYSGRENKRTRNTTKQKNKQYKSTRTDQTLDIMQFIAVHNIIFPNKVLFTLFMYWVHQNVCLQLSFISSRSIDRFSKFFHGHILLKKGNNKIIKPRTTLNCVATLSCEIIFWINIIKVNTHAVTQVQKFVWYFFGPLCAWNTLESNVNFSPLSAFKQTCPSSTLLACCRLLL